MPNEPIATGRVESLCLDGKPVQRIIFALNGPVGDRHWGFSRKISGHDGPYKRTSELKKGDRVLNTRSWTALSLEEMAELEATLWVKVPPGVFLENLIISGVPNFSKLAPTSRIVGQKRGGSQAILAVWGENGPCHVIGERLADLYKKEPGIGKKVITEAEGKRGVMGLVYSAGRIEVGDEVLVYPPVEL